jgi:hypothetical protein
MAGPYLVSARVERRSYGSEVTRSTASSLGFSPVHAFEFRLGQFLSDPRVGDLSFISKETPDRNSITYFQHRSRRVVHLDFSKHNCSSFSILVEDDPVRIGITKCLVV